MDVEPGIRTNTCILLSRLSKHLTLSTCRKVLIPAFGRSLRDPFTPARIAGLMALMATVEYYEKDDLAAKVIPTMSLCLVDKEKTVREQAFKALEMFVDKVRKAAEAMVRAPPRRPTLAADTKGLCSPTRLRPRRRLMASASTGRRCRLQGSAAKAPPRRTSPASR